MQRTPPERRWRAARSLTRHQWRTLSWIGATIVILHVLGFAMVIALVASDHHRFAAGGAFTIGIGVTAYTLGLRHAFDADHISAIDNTTRKLMSEGKRPLSVGFWFSLGHSSVVFALSLLISIGVRSLDGPVRDTSSQLHRVTNEVGTLVSGSFLYAIAAINVVILVGIVRVFSQMRGGH
jgi:high-affinity nickel-transport protein